MPIGRLLQFWIMTLVSICSLWAHADYSVLHYRLSDQTRLEAHFDSLAGDVPQIQFLLFHTDLEVPIVLDPKDPPFRFGHPEINAKNRKYTLPLPDNQEPLNLPEWAEVDLNDSWAWRNNLQKERMLIIGDHNSTGDFLHIFPIPKILVYRSIPTAVKNPTVFRLKQPRRLEAYPYREYSMTYVATARGEPFLIMSMRDKNNRNGALNLGTMAIAPDGQMQFQNETWQDLSGYDFKLSLEGDVYPKDGPPTAFKIYPSNSRTLDNPWGKPIYTGKNVRSWQSQWPGTTKKHWNFPTVAREYWEKMLGPIEWDNITFKILHRIATDEYNKGLKRESYQSFLSRQAVEKQDQQKEQKINEDLQVIEHFVKISGIEEDLKKMQLIPIGGYKVHQAQQTMSLAENSSVRKSPDTKIIILSAMVAASGDASSTDSSMKWMNWMVALDGNNNLIERRQLPGFLKSDDLMVRSDGGLRIRGTEFPPLQRPRLSCIKAHPFK